MRRAARIGHVLDAMASDTLLDDRPLAESLAVNIAWLPKNHRPLPRQVREAVISYYHGRPQVVNPTDTWCRIGAMPRDRRARLLRDCADFLRGGDT